MYLLCHEYLNISGKQFRICNLFIRRIIDREKLIDTIKNKNREARRSVKLIFFYIPFYYCNNHMSGNVHVNNGRTYGICIHTCNSCMPQTGMHGAQSAPCMPVCVMQLFCHPKYSLLYGALMILILWLVVVDKSEYIVVLQLQ